MVTRGEFLCIPARAIDVANHVNAHAWCEKREIQVATRIDFTGTTGSTETASTTRLTAASGLRRRGGCGSLHVRSERWC